MKDFFRFDPLNLGTKGLVFIGDEVLLYRRDLKTDKCPGCLDVPGGGAEEGETPFETFRRETKEEFNLELHPEDIVYVQSHSSIFEKGKFAYYAVAKLPANKKHTINLGNEGSEYLLMPLKQFLVRDDAWRIYQQRAADYADYTKMKEAGF